MTINLNPQTLIWTLAVIQPASAKEIRAAFSKLISEQTEPPTFLEVRAELDRQIEVGHVLCVSREPEHYYSLTYAGHRYLPPKLRRLRDKARLLLLNRARKSKFYWSRESCTEELVGASPTVDTSTTFEADAANKPVGRRRSVQLAYWPRLSRRFTDRTGPTADSRDTPLSLLSFASADQLKQACEIDSGLFSAIGIGVCLGISPGLVQKIAYLPDVHYRSFTLRKKGGGDRPIDSPRVFLKTIQSFVADYVLRELKVHENVHSYRHGKSNVTNALPHQGQALVANIDIRNFFGSISRAKIRRLLENSGFNGDEADTISRLCTKDNALPQGAPTSPVLSNALLYDFDREISRACKVRSLNYTRYADDITISGHGEAKIKRVIERCETLLDEKFKLALNKRKSRVATTGGPQVVTGIVVNVDAAPSRRVCRAIRAMVHNAKREGYISPERFEEIRGYVSYLMAFPKFKNSRTITEYLDDLKNLSKAAVVRPTRRRSAQAKKRR